MTKNFKLVLALLLAAMMLLTMVPAFATDPVYTLTVDKAEAGHTYTAYQIFKGTLANASGTYNTDNQIGDVTWGDNVSDAGKTALLRFRVTGDTTTTVPHASPLALSKYLGEHKTAATAIEFANLAATAANLTGAGKTGSITAETDDYVISNMPAGYYVVVDTFDSPSGKVEGKDYSIARYMVQVVGNATVVNKADKPTVEKKLKNADEADEQYRDANNVAVGDTINYQIKTSVPNMTEYNNGYWFVVKDHMSKGLKYVDGSLKVSVNGTEINTDKYTPTVGEYSSTDGTDIKVVFTDFKTNYLDHFGEEILITYSATLTNDAVVGTAGNPNNVEIVYSNNPNHDYGGKNEPGPGEDSVVGKTPKDWVKTYTINLKLTKVDKDDDTKKLAGAVFTIKGYKENDKATYTETYTADDEGTYYELDTDPKTYTEVAPTPLTTAKYTSTTQKYKLTVNNAITKDLVPVNLTATTDENGLITLNKIAAGRYVFTETTAPKGYNLLTEDVVIDIKVDTNTVSWSDGTSVASDLTVVADGSTAATWTATNATLNSDTFEFTVENGKGAELPETGGIGTTIFYVAGSITVLAAAILLITKRRMGAND